MKNCGVEKLSKRQSNEIPKHINRGQCNDLNPALIVARLAISNC